MLVPIVAMTVLMGVLPNIFLRPMAPAVERMLNQVRQGAPAADTGIQNRHSQSQVRYRHGRAASELQPSIVDC